MKQEILRLLEEAWPEELRFGQFIEALATLNQQQAHACIFYISDEEWVTWLQKEIAECIKQEVKKAGSIEAYCKCKCRCKERIDYDRGFFSQGYYTPTANGICWICQWGMNDGFTDVHGELE